MKNKILKFLSDYSEYIVILIGSLIFGPGIFGFIIFIIGLGILGYLIYYAKTCGSGCFNGLFLIIPLSLIIVSIPLMIFGGLFQIIF